MCILEIIVRIWFPQLNETQWLVTHDRYGRFQKSNFVCRHVNKKSGSMAIVKTNSLGLRDKEYVLSDDNVKRVLLIGDSFTFGWGLNTEATFHTKLEILLNERLGDYHVINAGVPGWGTLQEVTYAIDHFSLFKPDIIILTFCGNDVEDDKWYQDQLARDFQGYFDFPGKNFLRKHSHLFRLIRRNIWILKYNLDNRQREAKSKPNDVISHYDEQTGYSLTEAEWLQTLSVIEQFQERYFSFNPNGILLVQATAPWRQHVRDHLSLLENGVNMFYVDLYEDTKALTKAQRRLPHDGHWPEIIHTISAKRLFDKISEIEGPRL